MIWFSLCLLALAFVVFILLSILSHPPHWIFRYINRASCLTHVPIYFSPYSSKSPFKPILRRIHQTPPTVMTATQLVLSTPELVSEILQWDAGGYKEYDGPFNQTSAKTRFVNYALVNTLWFHEAMRYLWWTPLPFSKLRTLGRRLPRERKQVYANFVVDLVLENDPHGSYKENRILERLNFPRLRFVKIYIRPGQRYLSLPEIRGFALHDLTTDVRAGHSGMHGALDDNQMQNRLAKRLMVGFLNTGL
ncbi:hypothetical protein PEBR_18370 [Penicillium brasilianum]|uniref:Uncharacterized protein n=1 Tax=Penicillium brasilianum TaxID=104259 RepID=A0A1S9RQ53_PENBI|nr:hypothetical protein PEBR_18370 [Penicillium brasilianum]